MAESELAPGRGFEAGVALQSSVGPTYTIETITGPSRGINAEGVVLIRPQYLATAGLAVAMRSAGYRTHGATFEHALAEDTESFVLVRATPGNETGRLDSRSAAQARWYMAVASLSAYLNDGSRHELNGSE